MSDPFFLANFRYVDNEWKMFHHKQLKSMNELVDNYDPKMIFGHKFNMIEKYKKYYLCADFVFSWWKSLHTDQALFKAEEAYQKFIREATDEDKKKMGKFYKKADEVYVKAYNEYYERFLK